MRVTPLPQGEGGAQGRVRVTVRAGPAYEIVRKRTASYGIVRHRTRSYGIVRVRTRTYGNVQNAFRGNPLLVMHLGLSRGVLGASGANFGVVFVILASWAPCAQGEIRNSKLEIRKAAVSTQHSAFSLPLKNRKNSHQHSARCLLLSLADR